MSTTNRTPTNQALKTLSKGNYIFGHCNLKAPPLHEKPARDGRERNIFQLKVGTSFNLFFHGKR